MAIFRLKLHPFLLRKIQFAAKNLSLWKNALEDSVLFSNVYFFFFFFFFLKIHLLRTAARNPYKTSMAKRERKRK